MSSSSSSSSSNDLFYRQIRFPIISQNNYNLVPFSWIKEGGTSIDIGDDARLNFVIEDSNTPYLNYDAVLDRDNSSITETPTNDDPDVYVPNNEEVTHEESIYVDIIAEDVSGIKDVRVHTEPDKYEFEEVGDVFYTPKFSWDSKSLTTTTTTTQIVINSLLAGTESGKLYEIIYDLNNNITSNKDFQLSEYVNKITYATDKNDIYISTNENLYIYGADYFNGESDLYQKVLITNADRNIMSLYSTIWSVQAYTGKVVKMNDETLNIEKEYEGFDAPFKVLKSDYHSLLFVAGTNTLWTINETTDEIKSVYEINDYSIADFAIAPTGQIIILFNGANDSIIRIIDTDLYGMLLDERLDSNSNLRYCEYVEEGRFYALSELEVVSSTYGAEHYVFDINTETLTKTETSTDILQTTTTTTLGTTTKAVEVEKPNGGEGIQKGDEYEITWISSKSATDLVDIDLYKAGEFYASIESEVNNTGVYKWTVSDVIEDSNEYKIRVTWLSASSDPDNYDESNSNFTIGEVVTTTTTTTTVEQTEYAIGIDYDANNDIVFIVLKSGSYGVYYLSDNSFDGLYSLGISNVTSFALRDFEIGGINKQTKVRIWVGTNEYWADKWDSGIVETELKSMYYGGGNNLEPSSKYYAHIQTFSEDEGWGAVQIKEFIMPK